MNAWKTQHGLKLQQTSSICKFWQHVTSCEPLTYIIRSRRGKMTLLYSWPYHNICQRRPIISCEPFLPAELLTERLQCTRCVPTVMEKYSCTVQKRVDLCRSDNVGIITRCQQPRQVTCNVYLTYDWRLLAWVDDQRCTMLDCDKDTTQHPFISLLAVSMQFVRYNVSQWILTTVSKFGQILQTSGIQNHLIIFRLFFTPKITNIHIYCSRLKI